MTITLFSRLFYKANSIHEFPEYMRENVQQDFRNMFYEDFYRCVPPPGPGPGGRSGSVSTAGSARPTVTASY